MVLEGRVALVTGASRGIGAITAELLARRGAKVALSARTGSDLGQLATKIEKGGGQALAVVCDVMDARQVEEMMSRVTEKWGRLDIMVNNAGLGTAVMPVENIPVGEWDYTVALNLKSAFLCVRAVAPTMKRQRYGRIVNVSSLAGRNYGRLSGPHYGAAKAGLLGFTRHMAVELGPWGIWRQCCGSERCVDCSREGQVGCTDRGGPSSCSFRYSSTALGPAGRGGDSHCFLGFRRRKLCQWSLR